MKSVFIPRHLLLGLCAYVNQAELSLDRMHPNSREQITRFYDEQVRSPLAVVLARLRGLSDCNCMVTSDWREWARLLMSWHYILATRMSSFVQWHLHRGVFLPAWQVAAITQTLEQFEALVRQPQSYDLQAISDIRLRLCYGALMLERRIPVRLLARATRSVVHLNHSEHLSLKGVEEVAGTGWLECPAG
jgi:hypothetical protein